LEQSITSQSLQYLRNVGAVKTEREGKKIYYSLNEEKFAAIDKAVELLSK
jgi:DNA-binding transcriptional ArsR family regulator